MKLTWFDANSWLIESAGKRILIDPWLVGDLVFSGLNWFIKGTRSQPIPIPENIDLILLSQGLPDHAHPETLQQLDKSIPIIASPDGAQVASKFGYQSVTALEHGDSWQAPQDSSLRGLTVQTFVGAPVGVTKKENAYVVTFAEQDGLRLYYEPHGYPDTKHLQTIGRVDVAITPMSDMTILGVAPVIRSTAVNVAELLRPQVMLPTAEAGSVSYEGALSGALRTTAGAETVRSQLQEKGFDIQVIEPASRETVELDLRPLVNAT